MIRPRMTLPSDITRSLRQAGWLNNYQEPGVEVLGGGVSCDIWRVQSKGKSFVVKRALEKLRTQADWHADPSRNRYEQAYLRFVAGFLPGAVPQVFHGTPGFFVMEDLAEGWLDWKKHLLAGRVEPTLARQAGEVLGEIHRQSWGSSDLAQKFATDENFHELRVAPYLLTTAARHPDLSDRIQEEAARLVSTQRALVHGDFSPKNLMVREKRMVVLDCEVAWYGDPAFDVGFLLNHFLLKALHLPQQAEDFLALVHQALAGYRDKLGEDKASIVLADVPSLLLCLMLARVDGKSPVEYLTQLEKQEKIRAFVRRLLPASPKTIGDVIGAWSQEVSS